MPKQKDNLELIELTEKNIESMVYFIRGQKVMLDFDLARIYGYETKVFNQQVKRNIIKFPDDFMFRLNFNEYKQLARSQFVTAQIWTVGNEGGRTSLPFAFTEQGIYMLMTVLKGEPATKQSKALIRLFKKMKDYIVESNNLLNANGIIELTSKVNNNSTRLIEVEKKLDVIMDNFIDPSTYKHFLIMNGEKFEADIAYQKIYARAKKSILIVDDYINIKTLELLKSVKKGVYIYIFSDNKAKNKLSGSFLKDFMHEINNVVIAKPSHNQFHDRYIVIDYATENEQVYHCGSSSKDSGLSVTSIMRIEDSALYKNVFDKLFNE